MGVSRAEIAVNAGGLSLLVALLAGPATGAVTGTLATGPLPLAEPVTGSLVAVAADAPGLAVPLPPSLTAPAATADAAPVDVTTLASDERALVAVRFALAQLGLPYVWGGNGPQNGDAGFDCSGLTTAAYRAAGIGLPRTAHTQYYAGPRLPAGAPLMAGDLVFYGTPERVHHVGMYLGEGRMVNAPRRGKPVQVAYYRWNGDDYLGATRPAAAPGAVGSAFYEIPVPRVPAPSGPEVSEEFLAPPASLPATLPPPPPAAVAPPPGAPLTATPQPGATTPAAEGTGATGGAGGAGGTGGSGGTGGTGGTAGAEGGTAGGEGTPGGAGTPTTSQQATPTTTSTAPTTTSAPPTSTTTAAAPPDPTTAASAPAVDPVTGWPVDPVTGWPVDPVTGWPVDPATGQPVPPA